MIIRFNISNYHSFCELTEFNLLAGDIRTKKNHVKNINGVDVLKFSLLYGANGAGKSNLIKALETLQTMLQEEEVIDLSSDTHKFDSKGEEKPVTFELEYMTEPQNIFIYGLSISKDVVENEYLYISGMGRVKDKLIFERKFQNGKTVFEIDKKFLKLKKDREFLELFSTSILGNKELAIAKFLDFEDRLIEFNKLLNEAFKWFFDNLRIIHPNYKPQGLVFHLSLSDKFTTFCNELLSNMDIGITSLKVEEIDMFDFFGESDHDKMIIKDIKEELEEEYYTPLAFDVIAVKEINDDDEIKYCIKKLIVVHKNNDELIEFSFQEESDGTKRLIEYLSMVYDILNPKLNGVYIVDEMERSIHPHLLKEILKKLVNSENITGQLIFSTHESNLLDLELFRQDEIWLTEKNDFGATRFTPLSDFKIRNDLDIRNGYLKGRFGAIPILANLRDLNWYKNAN
ncbi:MAG TPA: ATP-binding protein [Fulvivirga sp.]|nr:ATP-binding protein [Fulvivirga sp.]